MLRVSPARKANRTPCSLNSGGILRVLVGGTYWLFTTSISIVLPCAVAVRQNAPTIELTNVARFNLFMMKRFLFRQGSRSFQEDGRICGQEQHTPSIAARNGHETAGEW